MSEEFLAFIWKYKLFEQDGLLWGNEKIEILAPGIQNTDAGPDFLDARVRIGATLWAGTVEIHVRSSDWYRHGHDRNAAFGNVVLHVVYQNDCDVYNSRGLIVPAMVLLFNPLLLENYLELLKNRSPIACAGKWHDGDGMGITGWITSTGVSALKEKTQRLSANLESTIYDWDEIFYRQLSRNFGFHINSIPFEMLARSLPYKILKKYAGEPLKTEALLFGQAGFLLDNYTSDEYQRHLQEEYFFLRAKHGLMPVDIHLWKFLRLRPGNFPTVRLAQLAALLGKASFSWSAVLDAPDVQSLRELMSSQVSLYWQQHYLFGRKAGQNGNHMGSASIDSIVVNTVVPLLFLYGENMGKAYLKDRAVSFLEQLPAENNKVIRQWRAAGLVVKSAFDSQALLHLKTQYCDRKKCIECGIGSKIIVSS